MLSRRLRALEYPEWSVFNPNDNGQMGKLLSWLEDTKIRFWKTEDRRAIRVTSSSSPAAAKAVFPSEAQRLYLKSVGCPARAMRTNAMVANWLVNHAISLEYRDMSKKKKKLFVLLFWATTESCSTTLLATVDNQDKDLRGVIQKEGEEEEEDSFKKQKCEEEEEEGKNGVTLDTEETALGKEAKRISSTSGCTIETDTYGHRQQVTLSLMLKCSFFC